MRSNRTGPASFKKQGTSTRNGGVAGAEGLHEWSQPQLRKRGGGGTLLVIPGLATDVSQIEDISRELSKHFRVVAIDNRGVGRSDKPDEPYSVAAMTDDAAGLLGAIGVSSADVLGISLGGRIALELTLRHPELVRRFILASTSARMNYPRGLLWTLSNLLIRVPAVRSIGMKYPQPYFAYVRQRDASRGYDSTDRLKEITKPTLILHGRNDKTAPAYLAEELQRGIAGSSLVFFDGGHMFMFSKQKEFAASVAGFLAVSGQ